VTIRAKQIAPELATVKEIPITVTYKGRSAVCNAVVDTGADVNFVPKSLIDDLKIDPNDASGKRTSTTINGEEIDLLFEDVTISVGDASVTGQAAIGHIHNTRTGREYCLLGQPFLGHFKTTLYKDMITFDKI
jgi:predicted aspartyl protease